MSYAASRWGSAQILRIGRDPIAVAVLGVITDAYRPDGRVPLSRSDIALRVGVAKVDTVTAALKRLAGKRILSYSLRRDADGKTVGTAYTLCGFREADWPSSRVGESVMVEQAIAAGCKPQPWWPKPAAKPASAASESKSDSPSNGESPSNVESPSGVESPFDLESPSSVESAPPCGGFRDSSSDGSKTVDMTEYITIYDDIEPGACVDAPLPSDDEIAVMMQTQTDLFEAVPEEDQLPAPSDACQNHGKASGPSSGLDTHRTATPTKTTKRKAIPTECSDFFGRHGIAEGDAVEWLRIRRSKGSKSFGPRAQALFEAEADRAGLSVAEAVLECIARSWAGFKAEWVAKNRMVRTPAAPRGRRAELLQSERNYDEDL